MNEIAITGLLLTCAIALSDWRRGMYLTVVVALLQDPIRKLVPGQPPYFILFAGLVFGAAFVGAVSSKVPLGPGMVIGWRRYLATPFQFFFLIVAAQAAHSLVRYGNPMVSALGLISYLAPFAALALAHAFAATAGSQGVHRLLLCYVVGSGIALATLYLESSGLELPIFGEVGVGIRIYDQGGLLTAYSGTFRASEIAAWHAAMCSCVVLLLATWRGVNVPRIVVALAIVGVIVALGVLTGRRKFIVMIAIFCSAYVCMLGIFWGRARAVAIPAALFGVFVYALFLLAADPDTLQSTQSAMSTADLQYKLYVQRTSSVFGDVNDRFLELGLAPIMWAYNWFGLLGGGAGIGTQGVQYMTEVGGSIGAAEGGLGKIMLELGLPGLIAVAALGFAFIQHIWDLLSQIRRQSAQHIRLACALAAILIANLASFSVATQAFGDVFILLFLGLCLGTLMAMPRMVASDRELAERSARLRHARPSLASKASMPI